MAVNDHNIPEENYPQRPGKQPMTNPKPDERTKKRNEELARLAVEAQAAQPQPSQENQDPPPRDVHVPPRRPRGRPRKNAATRGAKQPPPPAKQRAPLRPRRNTQARASPNSTAELPEETGNNRAPTEAWTQVPGNTQNVAESAWANSGPSRPRNGW
ncbi:uncharacterized protein LOC133779830 [Humulus lupulus]|uniref:uncharacterized protein LOC133779830 n=1 Tax=Humulus lupulus TaxID=3486 RepID=UPI002B40E51A|nr:uncharacterized protein LOC133779830 [Humulus lupulus]